MSAVDCPDTKLPKTPGRKARVPILLMAKEGDENAVEDEPLDEPVDKASENLPGCPVFKL